MRIFQCVSLHVSTSKKRRLLYTPAIVVLLFEHFPSLLLRPFGLFLFATFHNFRY